MVRRPGLVSLAVLALFCVAFYALRTDREGEEPYPDHVDSEVAHSSDPGTRILIRKDSTGATLQALDSHVSARYSERNNLAIEALGEGRLEEAVTLFEECHQGDPEEPVFAANLAEALARLARDSYVTELDPSIPIGRLRRATELAPERSDLAALLERWEKGAETEKDFWTDETEHFLLSYDGNRSDLMHRGYSILTVALESAYSEYLPFFEDEPVGQGDAKIRVVLYLRQEFTELTGIGHWAGGVYDGVVRIPVVDFDSQRAGLERVLRHELIHAFIKDAGGAGVPAWLNEGLAQWHEHGYLDERSAKVGAARKLLSGRTLLPLDELVGSFSRWSDEKKIELGYAQALALVSYLDRWYGERVLYEMVEGCSEGRKCEVTFLERTGVELAGVVGDFAERL
jgi:hypothetical protein